MLLLLLILLLVLREAETRFLVLVSVVTSEFLLLRFWDVFVFRVVCVV